MKMKKYKVCSNCVMDTSDTNINFDENGVCERCNEYYNKLLPSWNKGLGNENENELSTIIAKIKKEGEGEKYDCLLGFSGGFDSSYMLHLAVKEFGLRPLVFHVDAGWNTTIAEENISKMVDKLNIDLKMEIVNWEEMKNFQLSFFKSGVPHLDIPQDHAFFSILDQFAVKYNIKYILNGGNFSTEVIAPPSSWYYWGTDIKHINDILTRFGTIPMKTYPFTSILRRKIYMPYIKRVKIITPLNLLPYDKKKAETFLKNEYGWTPYPQKHFESIMTKFIEGYWLPKRFGYDMRKPQLSSLILTEQMSRSEALEILKKPPLDENEARELFSQVSKMLEITEDELNEYLTMPLKSYKDYKHQDYLFNVGATIMHWLKLDKLIRK